MRILLALIFLSLVVDTAGYSTGSGHCEPRGSRIASGHGAQRQGKLSDGDYFLSSGSGQLSNDNVVEFSTGVDNKISLKARGDDFKGFLFRLTEINGESAEGLLEVGPSSQEDAQPASKCLDPKIPGITHISASLKDSVDVIIRHDQPIELRLEVTVVKQKAIWYYESFRLNLVKTPTPPPVPIPTTPPPVSIPVAGPTTPTPNVVPTTSPPTLTPSTAPSADGTSTSSAQSLRSFGVFATVVSVFVVTATINLFL